MLQIKALLSKNWICSIRDREYISELILPMVTAIIVSLKEQLSFLVIFAPLFLAVAVNSAPRSLLINLVQEKSDRFKETQKIMGMKQRYYTIGWILYGFMKTMISTLVLLILWTIANAIINDGDFNFTCRVIDMFMTYILYAIATMNQSLMLSSIFSDPKLASEVTTFMTILSILLTFLVFLDSVNSSLLYYILLSIFPSSSISFAYISVQGSSSVFNSKVVHETYPLSAAATQLGVEAVIYFFLYFYLDQVFPNEYGVAKHPLWFIKDRFNKNNKTASLLLEEQISLQDTSSALYHQQIEKTQSPSVQIHGLTKKFGAFTAVDHLTISLYNSEILCLLGHNGAGKTTTISMLTGMIEKTSGRIMINGAELEQNIDLIRENVGICSQRDVLYEQLTVYEQLRFMGQVKGLSGSELEQDIDEILHTTELEYEREKRIAILSGGNKRKLSLAMALIGGSSVIFLDEPTSGMDAMSRTVIWKILEKVKAQNRTLVLTTHHLDEAEHLADRIAIMAAGKLLACGTADYIKSNFGDGYQLSITTTNENTKQSLKQIVTNLVPEAILDYQSSSNTLLYQIPHAQKFKLENLFNNLQSQFGDSIQINLVMNSLEDAFVNIGMDEEKFIQRAKQGMTTLDNNDESQNITAEFKAIESKQLKIPDCLNRPPEFIFLQQFIALFQRKWYTTVRSFSNYIAIIIPFTLIVIGTLIINEIPVDFIENPDTLQYFKLVLISLFVILAFCFNSQLFITLPVLEREFNLKYALTVMGCRMLPYWLGTYAFDYLLYTFFVIIFVVFSYIMNLTFITNQMGVIVLIFIGFGFAYISFSYFCGIFLYKKTSTAMKSFPFVNFFIVYCMPQNIWGVFALLYQKDIGKSFSKDMIYIIEAVTSFISPFFSFQRAFGYVIKQQADPKRETPPALIESPYYYAMTLFVQGAMFFGLTLLLEYRSNNSIAQVSKQPRQELKKSIRIDEEVFAEENAVRQSNAPIKVLDLMKVFENGCVALNGLSVGVREEEILGLLGPNGAGKSTMFSILTSLISKSSGSVKINGVEVERNATEVFRNVGICPQFDCIWENLTPVEHLYLFGRMKGLSGKDLDESVEYFIQTMQLEEYVRRQAGRLSGGNKRKLCVSNALIGGPSIQFFDEPSTGVDPIARRFLWKTLKLGVKLRKSSVVITTHTMDEAQSLCDRIAILINGQIYCLGSPQELRNKFGNGYNVVLKGQQVNSNQILKQIKIKAEVLEEVDREYITLHIKSQDFNFYVTYALLSQLVDSKVINDFSINQSSLESVFLQFSKQQQQTD